jgi:hypothetical protein
MKNFRQFCAAVVLALLFTIFASAGEIPGPGVTNPPPPQQSSVTGDMPGPGATATGDVSTLDVIALDPVIETTLNLLQSVMFFF